MMHPNTVVAAATPALAAAPFGDVLPTVPPPAWTDPSEESVFGALLNHPLLTAAQEIALAWAIRAGAAAERTLEIDSPTCPHARVALHATVARGSDARATFTYCNLSLIRKISRKYRNRGLSDGDLFQEGWIGLNTAITKFDPSKGFRFSTYATWWIRQAMGRALAEQGRLIRLPVHIVDNLHTLRTIYEAQEAELKRPPSAAEFAVAAGLGSEERARDVLAAVLQQVVPLDGSGDDDEHSALADLYAADEDTAEDALVQLRADIVGDAIDRLPDIRSRIIVKFRFAFPLSAADAAWLHAHAVGPVVEPAPNEPTTYTALGAMLGVGRERVAQIEKDTLALLRIPLWTLVEDAPGAVPAPHGRAHQATLWELDTYWQPLHPAAQAESGRTTVLPDMVSVR